MSDAELNDFEVQPHAKSTILRLVAEVRRLRAIIDRALAAGHCHPCTGSDPGLVLVDHCEGAHRDLLERAAEIERLEAVLESIADMDAETLRNEGRETARAAIAPPADQS